MRKQPSFVGVVSSYGSFGGNILRPSGNSNLELVFVGGVEYWQNLSPCSAPSGDHSILALLLLLAASVPSYCCLWRPTTIHSVGDARQSMFDWLPEFTSSACKLVPFLGCVVGVSPKCVFHSPSVPKRGLYLVIELITCTTAFRHSPGTRAPCRRGHPELPARCHREGSRCVPGQLPLILLWL